MNREQILEQIMLEMVEIKHVEKGQFRHNHKHVMATLVKESIAKYDIEWEGASDIIRDEVYYVVWKAINKFNNDYTIGELELILEQLKGSDESKTKELRTYLNSLKKYVQMNIRNYLLPEGRKDENRRMIDVITESTDFDGLDYLVSYSIDEDSKMSHFMEWCLENWQTVLTTKQVNYMNGLEQETTDEDLTMLEKKNKYIREKNMRNRISKRLLDRYNSIYCGNRTYNEALGAIHKIENILERADFVRAVLDNHETDYIIDAIYSHVAIADIKVFNHCTHNLIDVPADVQRQYRVALFRKLKELYAKVEN